MLPSSSYDAFYVQHPSTAAAIHQQAFNGSTRSVSPASLRQYISPQPQQPPPMAHHAQQQAFMPSGHHISGADADLAFASHAAAGYPSIHHHPHHHAGAHSPSLANGDDLHGSLLHSHFIGGQAALPAAHHSVQWPPQAIASSSKGPFLGDGKPDSVPASLHSGHHSPWASTLIDDVHIHGEHGTHDDRAALYDRAFDPSPSTMAPFSIADVSAPREGISILGTRVDLDDDAAAGIGNDSGSGGTRRPQPRKRRKTAKGAVAASGQGNPSLASLLENNEVESLIDGVVEIGQSGRSATIDEEDEPTMDDQLTASSNDPMYNESMMEFGALHQGLEGTEDEPLYVNPKQYNRILKRRDVRARMEEKRRRTEEAIQAGRLMVPSTSSSRKSASALNDDDESKKKPYQHESRHRHAMRRRRGPGGRFLTADEIKALEAAEQAQGGPSPSQPPQDDAGAALADAEPPGLAHDLIPELIHDEDREDYDDLLNLDE